MLGGYLVCLRLQGQLPAHAAPIYIVHNEGGG